MRQTIKNMLPKILSTQIEQVHTTDSLQRRLQCLVLYKAVPLVFVCGRAVRQLAESYWAERLEYAAEINSY